MWFFRAVALDLDGTLTDGGKLYEGTMAAIRTSRDQRRMILVTGRIFDALVADFPTILNEFDAVVTENGAVLHIKSDTRLLASPVDLAIQRELTGRGVRARAGHVLLALEGQDATTAMEVIAGRDCQLVANRNDAMILPAGVTKGTGLLAALNELGLSPHNAVAVGDAENDLALLQAAEVGVAVANAVPSLATKADLHLQSRNGFGVIELLTGPLLTGRQRLCPSRRWVQIGSFDDGQPVLIPGSQASVLIAGDNAADTNFIAGLLAERWIEAGYAVLIVDPEGNHIGLAQRPEVHLVDAAPLLPTPTNLLAIIRSARASLVLDLSGLPDDSKVAYLNRLPRAVAIERAQHGVPHWVITDEAHSINQASPHELGEPDLAEPGICTATWRPGTSSAADRDTVDVALLITGTSPATAEAPMTTLRTTISVKGQPARPFTVTRTVSSGTDSPWRAGHCHP